MTSTIVVTANCCEDEVVAVMLGDIEGGADEKVFLEDGQTIEKTFYGFTVVAVKEILKTEMESML